jgi:hypothetical protein
LELAGDGGWAGRFGNEVEHEREEEREAQQAE